MRRMAGVAVGLAMGLAGTLAGQVRIEQRPRPAPKQEAPGRVPNIRVDTTLILVPVTVNDPLNRPVSGLEKENFRVFEDKVPQPITQFAMDDEAVVPSCPVPVGASWHCHHGTPPSRRFFPRQLRPRFGVGAFLSPMV